MQLAGELSKISLPSLIQLVRNGGLTGEISLSQGANNAKIYVEQGRIVHVESDLGKGKEIFLELFLWLTGTFSFVESKLVDVPRTFPKDEPIDRLLREGIAYLEEKKYLDQLRITGQTVLKPSEAGKAAGNVPLLDRLDGTKTLSEALADAKLSRRAYVKAVYMLLSEGLVVVAEPVVRGDQVDLPGWVVSRLKQDNPNLSQAILDMVIWVDRIKCWLYQADADLERVIEDLGGGAHSLIAEQLSERASLEEQPALPASGAQPFAVPAEGYGTYGIAEPEEDVVIKPAGMQVPLDAVSGATGRLAPLMDGTTGRQAPVNDAPAPVPGRQAPMIDSPAASAGRSSPVPDAASTGSGRKMPPMGEAAARAIRQLPPLDGGRAGRQAPPAGAGGERAGRQLAPAEDVDSLGFRLEPSRPVNEPAAFDGRGAGRKSSAAGQPAGAIGETPPASGVAPTGRQGRAVPISQRQSPAPGETARPGNRRAPQEQEPEDYPASQPAYQETAAAGSQGPGQDAPPAQYEQNPGTEAPQAIPRAPWTRAAMAKKQFLSGSRPKPNNPPQSIEF